MLTPEQKRHVCAIAAIGCDRRIAVRYLGCDDRELQAELERDAEFARDLMQAEARAELTHIRNVQQAAQDDKHWRASVWWLERRAADRYGGSAAGSMTPAKARQFVETLATIIAEEVRGEADRQRLLYRLTQRTSNSTGEGAG